VGSKEGFGSEEETLEALNRGWVIVSIDYRLAPGVLLPAIVEDVEDAYEWVRTELVEEIDIDPNNIILMGQSAGGGLGAMAGFLLNPRPKAMILFYPGCTDCAK